MKKLIALVLALVMCFALCACGQSAAPAATEAPAAEPAADAAADTAAVEYPEMTLKLSHHNAVDQPIHEALTKWATMINEQSGGKITIDIYPAASLYNQTDAQDAVQMGTLDMCLADCSQLSSAVPAFALTAMPFLYDSYETAGKVIFGEVGAQLDQQLDELGLAPLHAEADDLIGQAVGKLVHRQPRQTVRLAEDDAAGIGEAELPAVIPCRAQTARKKCAIDGFKAVARKHPHDDFRF